jgi:hypothetical protein
LTANTRHACVSQGDVCKPHHFIANQRAIATATTKTTAHMIGVTRFELPLRGEAFAARSNDLAIGKPF